MIFPRFLTTVFLLPFLNKLGNLWSRFSFWFSWFWKCCRKDSGETNQRREGGMEEMFPA